jgi:hypothetical protein
MTEEIKPGDCVKIPDGRIARVRTNANGVFRVRVRRKTSQNHQIQEFLEKDLVKVTCPQGLDEPSGI